MICAASSFGRNVIAVLMQYEPADVALRVAIEIHADVGVAGEEFIRRAGKYLQRLLAGCLREKFAVLAETC